MTDLEQALRDMLHDRAGDIDAVPAGLLPASDQPAEELLPPARFPGAPRQWWPAVVAAVAIVVAAAAVGAAQLGGHHTSDTGSAAPTTVSRTSCAAIVPASWRAAAAQGTLDDPTGGSAWGITATGAVALTQLELTPDNQSAVDISTLLPVVGAHPHHLVTLPATNGLGQLRLAVDGNAIVVALSHQAAGGGDVLPTELVVVNASTGATRTVLDSPATTSPLLSEPYVADGKVYWDLAANGSQPSEVHEYDIATGTAQVVGGGPTNTGLQQSAAGVWWSGDEQPIDRPELLPRTVAANATGVTARVSLTTDGTSYAWATGTGIAWSAGSEPVVETTVGVQTILAVAGPLVIFDGTQLRASAQVLDTRTGAVAPLAGSTFITDRGILVTDQPLTGSGQFTTAVIRIDATHLPRLHC